MDIATVLRGADLIRQGMEALNSGPLEFYLNELVSAHNLLMERFAPFKIGDRVRLTRTPEITNDVCFGWIGHKHFLVEGSVGTVRDAGCGSRGFWFLVALDEQSWIHYQTGQLNVVPENERGLFEFGEHDLAPSVAINLPP
jgi:hypothetical protein